MRRVLTAVLLLAFLSNISGPALAAAKNDSSDGSHLIAPATVSQMVSESLQNLQLLAIMGAGGMFDTAASHARPTVPTAAEMLAFKATAQTGVSSGVGVRVQYPGMLQTVPLPESLLHNNANISRPPSAMLLRNAPAIRGALIARPAVPQGVRTAQSVTLGAASITGINPWWSYEEGAIPGVGKYMVNVANGNLVVQSDDADIPERGLDLAFRRTYNSNSGRDWTSTDGSSNPGQFGGGWTNTFDAHLASNSAGGISVFDIDGARYDYATNGPGCLTPPPGMFNKLCSDGVNGYYWYKKSGTVYYFIRPDVPAGQQALAGFAGRLYGIYGRNHNNTIAFNYSWVGGDASKSANLTQIVAQHSDGHALTLAFWNFSGQQLLKSITRPDGVQIVYAYDAAGNLAAVTEPTNGNACSTHDYNFTTAHQINWAAGPRWMCTGTDGGYINFGFTGGVLANIAHVGYMNPTPADGTNTPLQPGGNGSTYLVDYFSGFNSPETLFSDTDGHATNWFYDASQRVTHTQDKTGDVSGPPNLDTHATWDPQNNLSSSTDARGNATNYAYDANGNTLGVALPLVNGFRSTTLLSYDNNYNVLTSCDPVSNHSAGRDWSGSGTPPICPNASGATRFSYTVTTNEPYGELTQMTTPMGYLRQIAYNPTGQGGDYGLPTSVTGTGFTQADGTPRSPQQLFGYEAHGNLTSYNPGNGASTASYNALNRPIQTTDSDNISSYTYYYANGQVQKTETAAQHVGGNGALYAYDKDGNQTSETHHFGGLAGITTNFYDGADRLVEVQQPQDVAHDAFAFPWAVRYIYDLSVGGTQSINGGAYGSANFAAHGNLSKIQKYIGGPIYTGLSGGYASWQDISGNAYDALDRPVTRYNFQPGQNLVHWTYAYDALPGALTSETTPTGDVVTPSYDNQGQTTNVHYAPGSASATTPDRTVTYDANGRVTRVSTTAFGAMNYVYDAEGRLQSSTEALGGGGIAEFSNSGAWNSNTTLNYSYYPNGWPSGLGVSSSLLNQSDFERDSYRADGLPTLRTYKYGNTSYPFAWQYSLAGRLTAKSDANNGVALTAGYDSFGRLQSYGVPEGAYSAFGFDPEGEVTAYTFTSVPGPSVTNVSLTYSNRGELLGNGTKDANGNNVIMQSADGFMYAAGARCISYQFPSKPGVHTSCGTTTPKFDARMSATLGTQFTPNAGQPNIPRQFLPPAIAYDPSMRISSGITHDVDNHDVYEQGSLYEGYSAWGPNGHPTVSRATFTDPETGTTSSVDHYLHWNGGQVLYTSNNNGVLDDIKLGSQGDIFPGSNTGLNPNFWDREFTGVAIGTRNATGHGNTTLWAPGSTCENAIASLQVYSTGFTPPPSDPSSCSSAGQIVQPRTDGYYNGVTFINGVRNFSAGANSWTSPDALGGQQPFAYANNNAMAFSDPSGFCADGASNSQLLNDPTCQIANVNSGCSWSCQLDRSNGDISGMARGGSRDCGACGDRPGALWLPCGKDYDSSGDSCQRADGFVKVELNSQVGIVSKMALCGGYVTSTGRAAGYSATPISFSATFGAIFPNLNKTSNDVAQGASGGGEIGDVGGLAFFSNRNGWGAGLMLTTPTIGGSATFGFPNSAHCKK